MQSQMRHTIRWSRKRNRNVAEYSSQDVGSRAVGAPGGQAAGTGVQLLESSPASPSLGFDPNPSVEA